MKTITLGNYTLTTKYNVPTIIITDYDFFGDEDITEITYETLEDAFADMLYFLWEDKELHNLTEIKQLKTKDKPKGYKEYIERELCCGFIRCNTNVVLGLK